MRYHPGPLIHSESALQAATAGLLEKDREIVSVLIEIGGPPPLRWREPGFSGLAGIIVSQQVSVASANAIFGRLEKRFQPLDAASLLAADDAALRECGLSLPKMKALRALARAVAHEGLDLDALGALDAHDAHVRSSRSAASVRGPPISSCCSASAIPTRFPPATSRCRRRRKSRSA